MPRYSIQATLIAAVALASPALALPAGYDIVRAISSTNQNTYDSLDDPHINDRGDLLFRARLAGSNTRVVAHGTRPDLRIAATSPGGFTNFAGLALSPTGQAYFKDLGLGTRGWYRGPGMIGDAVVTSAGPFDASFSFQAGTNSSGRFVFYGELDSNGPTGLFDGPDPVSNAIVTDAGVFDGFSTRFGVSDTGIAFIGFLNQGATTGIYTGPSPLQNAVVTNAGPLDTFSEVSLSQNGRIIYAATTDLGTRGIYNGPNPATDLLANTLGDFHQFFTLSINNSGDYLFNAELDDGRRGVFFGPDADSDFLIRDGDGLFGSSVRFAFATTGSLNNLGEAAFAYELENEERGIAIAIRSHRYTATGSGSFDDLNNWAFLAKPRAVVPTIIRPNTGAVIQGPEDDVQLHSLTLGTATSGVAELRTTPTSHLTVNDTLTVESRGRLVLDGSMTVTGAIHNRGEIRLVPGAVLDGGLMTNTGLIRGGGSIANAVTNRARIESIGTPDAPTELIFTGAVTNTAGGGLITARNALIRFDAGLTNAGSLGLSFGTTDLFGDIDNTGTIALGGTAQVTFYDDVIQNGTMLVPAVGSTTSVAVFMGAFSGAGGFGGGGDVFFLGDLRPGNSPASVSMGGNVFFGPSTQTFIELAGTSDGLFDQLLVAGQLQLDGGLDVSLIPGFALSPGQEFEVIVASQGLFGSFAGLPDGALVGSYSGIDLTIHYRPSSVVLTAIPEPGTLLYFSALAGIALHRRRCIPSRLGSGRVA